MSPIGAVIGGSGLRDDQKIERLWVFVGDTMPDFRFNRQSLLRPGHRALLFQIKYSDSREHEEKLLRVGVEMPLFLGASGPALLLDG